MTPTNDLTAPKQEGLMPCPFCGCQPELQQNGKGCSFVCSNYDCPVGWISTEEGFKTVEAWNARAIPTPQAHGVEVDEICTSCKGDGCVSDDPEVRGSVRECDRCSGAGKMPTKDKLADAIRVVQANGVSPKSSYGRALKTLITAAKEVEKLRGMVKIAEAALEKIAKRPDLPNPDRDADWKNCMKWSSYEARETLAKMKGEAIKAAPEWPEKATDEGDGK